MIKFSGVKDIFINNKTVRQTIFKNTFWLAAASGLGRFLSFFLFVYATRILGPTKYGEFTFALGFVGLLIIFSDLGISRIAVRELSRDKDKEKDYPSLLSLKFILILITWIAVFIGAFLVSPDPAVRKVIWILAGYITIGNFAQIIYVFLESQQRMEHESLAKILEAVLHVGFGLFVIFNFPSVENFAYSYLASISVFMALFITFFHFKIHRLHFNWDRLVWKRYLKMSWPLALSSLFSSIYNHIDTVMLGLFGQITQVGWYNAAYGIATTAIIPATIISTSFFPALNKAYGQTKEKFQEIWNYHIETMIFLSFPLMVGGAVLAPKIINFVFSSSFYPSALAFQILITMSGLAFIYIPFYHALIATHQQKKIFWAIMAGAVINIILNLIFIPKYSLYGAAFSSVITWLLILILMFGMVSKFTLIKPLNPKVILSLTGAVVSSIIMYFAISQPQIYSLHILFSVLVGALIYLTCFFGYKKIIKKLIKQDENYASKDNFPSA